MFGCSGHRRRSRWSRRFGGSRAGRGSEPQPEMILRTRLRGLRASVVRNPAWLVVGLLAAAVAARPALAQTATDPHARAYERSLASHLTREEALGLAEEHLRAAGPAAARLGVATISDVLATVEILRPDGKPAGRVIVDRRTGWVRTEP